MQASEFSAVDPRRRARARRRSDAKRGVYALIFPRYRPTKPQLVGFIFPNLDEFGLDQHLRIRDIQLLQKSFYAIQLLRHVGCDDPAYSGIVNNFRSFRKRYTVPFKERPNRRHIAFLSPTATAALIGGSPRRGDLTVDRVNSSFQLI